MAEVLILGVAGGTGSGKTRLKDNILKHFGDEIAVISYDNYYKRHDELPFEERCKLNYDEPAAFETELLTQHLATLRAGRAIDCPVYDFTVHNRSSETIRIEPKAIIVVEGILIFTDEALRNQMDIKIFVDTDADVRLCRRIKRDIRDRGRSLESVLTQYQQTVKPMHDLYVEPSKRYADIVVLEGGKNKVALDLITSHLRFHLGK